MNQWTHSPMGISDKPLNVTTYLMCSRSQSIQAYNGERRIKILNSYKTCTWQNSTLGLLLPSNSYVTFLTNIKTVYQLRKHVPLDAMKSENICDPNNLSVMGWGQGKLAYSKIFVQRPLGCTLWCWPFWKPVSSDKKWMMLGHAKTYYEGPS